MMITKRRVISIVMAVVMVMSTVLIATDTTYAASKTVTGVLTDGYGSSIRVYTNGKAAKLRVCTFNQRGARTSGKITVRAIADNGAVYKWNVKGCNSFMSQSTNITLPKGNTRYRVQIRRNGGSNSNRTKTFYVSVDLIKNCWR